MNIYMPFKVVKKKDNYYYLYRINEKTFAKSKFKTKESAINQAKNWMRYRKEKPVVKGNLITGK